MPACAIAEEILALKDKAFRVIVFGAIGIAVEKSRRGAGLSACVVKRMAAFSDAVYKRRVQPDAVPLGRKYVFSNIGKANERKNNEALYRAMLRLYLMAKKDVR